ncbi:MAG: HAMP domain-containing sensor histidine kinase [Eubacterium sp.]|nr:HAMP domain-containing sensor histidine kinase [Eubacterium sp.]
MEKKLQFKFVCTATIGVIILLCVALIPLNLMNFRKTESNLHTILQYIVDHDGTMPTMRGTDDATEIRIDPDTSQGTSSSSAAEGDAATESAAPDRADSTAAGTETSDTTDNNNGGLSLSALLQHFYLTADTTINPESSYKMRYFTLFYDADGALDSTNISHIAQIDEETAVTLGEQVSLLPNSYGLIIRNGTDYCFLKSTQDDGTKMTVFLDCDNELESLRQFRSYSFLFGILATIVFVIIVSLLSHRALEPMFRNMHAQKEFITNAGHELKTPLAIISANTEVLEMVDGKNEWTESTMKQVKRLTGLVNDLVLLAKMDEQVEITLQPIDVSAPTAEVAESFRTLIEQKGKTLATEISPDLTAVAEAKYYHELVSILVDNAAKYCDDKGQITVTLSRAGVTGKATKLTVSNTYADGANVDYSRFFNRFYREDTSHNSKKSGYGIGLSMAQKITEIFKGRISADYKNGVITFTVIF